MRDRVAVFIDGMNTRHFLRATERVEFIDVRFLAEVLAADEYSPGQLVSCDYFVGKPIEAHLGADRYKEQVAYYAEMESQGPLVTVHYGYLAKRPSIARATWGDVRIRRWVEKQVDV